MNEQETRRAIHAGIVDAFGTICKGAAVVLVVAALIMRPFIWLAILAAIVVAVVAWLLVLRWLLPSTWHKHSADKRFRADRAEYLAADPSTPCGLLLRTSHRLRSYNESKARMKSEQAHPSNWEPFEQWRAQKATAASSVAGTQLSAAHLDRC
jgi:hypothetical protein